MAQQRRVSSSQFARLAQLGRLAGGLAGGMVSEGARRLAQGQRPRVADLLLTPANAQRVAQRLAEMRGAAMKVGQLLSMDSGAVLPPQLAEILARLREDADAMPLGQVAERLTAAWGADWQRRFARFHFTPIAAASIGQVHEAVLKDGRRLAVKLQYPGIRRSIDSDVDNVVAVLRAAGIVPVGMDTDALFDEARRQLHREADYRCEAQLMERYAARLGADPRFELPQVVDELSGPEVLTMTYLDGAPIETLAAQPARRREAAAEALVELALREVFDWGLVQTDPNFANYRVALHCDRVQLLDFGAVRDYDDQQRADLRSLLAACMDGSSEDVADAACAVGYLHAADPTAFRDAVVRLLHLATEPARTTGPFDFGRSNLAERMRDTLVDLRVTQRHVRLPPPGILFLHRKLGGLYLLLARLQARVDVRELARRLPSGTVNAAVASPTCCAQSVTPADRDVR